MNHFDKVVFALRINEFSLPANETCEKLVSLAGNKNSLILSAKTTLSKWLIRSGKERKGREGKGKERQGKEEGGKKGREKGRERGKERKKKGEGKVNLQFHLLEGTTFKKPWKT